MAVDNKKIEEIYHLVRQQLSQEEQHILSQKLLEQEQEKNQTILALQSADLLMTFPSDFFNAFINENVGYGCLEIPIHINGQPLSETIIEDRI